MEEEKKEKNRVLIIEQANIELKSLVNNSMLVGYDKAMTKDIAKSIIKKCITELKEMDSKDKQFLSDVELALKRNFLKWYTQMTMMLQQFAKRDNVGLVRQTLEKMNIPYKSKFKDNTNALLVGRVDSSTISLEQEEIENLRDLMTVYDEGAAGRYSAYIDDLQQNIINVEHEIASGSLTLIDSKGRTKSIRNMAEIKTRYELIQGDMQRLEKKGVKYVVATAHANCSERCQHWQGKTFIFDIDISTRDMNGYDPAKTKAKCKPINKDLWIDGRETYSLKDAIECGFLSYNCQHRVVAYAKGVNAPKYDAVTVENKRNISQTQRALENEIRKAKQEQILLTGKDRQLAAKRSKKLQNQYEQFCKDNKVPYYKWRTQITEVERNFNPVLQGGSK